MVQNSLPLKKKKKKSLQSKTMARTKQTARKYQYSPEEIAAREAERDAERQRKKTRRGHRYEKAEKDRESAINCYARLRASEVCDLTRPTGSYCYSPGSVAG